MHDGPERLLIFLFGYKRSSKSRNLVLKRFNSNRRGEVPRILTWYSVDPSRAFFVSREWIVLKIKPYLRVQPIQFIENAHYFIPAALFVSALAVEETAKAIRTGHHEEAQKQSTKLQSRSTATSAQTALSLSLHAMDAVAQLLNAQSAAEECTACASLLREWATSDRLVLQMAAQPPLLSAPLGSEATAQQQQPPPVLSSMLEELLLFFMLRAFGKDPGKQITTSVKSDVLAEFVARWSPQEAHDGDEFARQLTSLKGYVLCCMV